VECARAFVGASFSGAERHARRVAKVLAIEPGSSARADGRRARPGYTSAVRSSRWQTRSPYSPGRARRADPRPRARPGRRGGRPSRRRGRWVERLHDRDGTIWSEDPEVQARIANRLGWLDAPVTSATRSRRWRHSGRASGQPASRLPSSPDGRQQPGAGCARRRLPRRRRLADRPRPGLDRPAAVEAAWDGLDPLATLVIVATKSGTTTESLAFQADAWARIHAALRAAGERRESPPT